MNDELWTVIRYALIGGGGFLAGKGYGTAEQFTALANDLPSVISGVTAVGSAIWGLYVRWNTRAVPAVTAARVDVPTINPITGATEPGTAHTK